MNAHCILNAKENVSRKPLDLWAEPHALPYFFKDPSQVLREKYAIIEDFTDMMSALTAFVEL